MPVAKLAGTHYQQKLLLCTTKIGLMFTVPYASHLSISGPGRCNLMEEIGCLIVKCVVRGDGAGVRGGWGSLSEIAYHLRHNNIGAGLSKYNPNSKVVGHDVNVNNSRMQ